MTILVAGHYITMNNNKTLKRTNSMPLYYYNNITSIHTVGVFIIMIIVIIICVF